MPPLNTPPPPAPVAPTAAAPPAAAPPAAAPAADWRSNALLADVPPALLRHLAPLLRLETHAPGTDVLREGDPSDGLCLLGAGQVAVLKGPEEARLATLAPGSYFGEMGVLTGEPRATTVRAEQASQVWRISRAGLQQFAAATGFDLLAHSLRSQVTTLSQRLQNTNQVAADSVRERMEEYRLRVAFGSLATNVILLLFLYISALGVLRQASATGSSSTLTTSALLVLTTLGAAWMVRSSGLPPATFGLSWQRWRWVLTDSLLWTGLFCLGMTAAKWGLLHTVPRFAGLHLLQPWASAAGTGATVLAYSLYVLLSPMQEFVARGLMQGSLQRMLTGPRAPVRAVLAANAVFSLSHQHLGLGYALAVFFPGLLWGWMYHRHGSLLGVCVSHVLIGLWGTGALDLASLVG